MYERDNYGNVFTVLFLCTVYVACGKSTGDDQPGAVPIDTASTNDTTIRRMKVKIGSTTFQATLANNPGARASQQQSVPVR